MTGWGDTKQRRGWKPPMGTELSGLSRRKDWRTAAVMVVVFFLGAMLIAFVAFG